MKQEKGKKWDHIKVVFFAFDPKHILCLFLHFSQKAQGLLLLADVFWMHKQGQALDRIQFALAPKNLASF